MAFTGSHIEITLRYEILGQKCQTARLYTWDGVVIAAASAAQVGEAWWNHYKDAWRDLAPDAIEAARFVSVLVREVGGSLSYGEYAIPTGEQAGTRADPGGQMLPTYCAVGCRFTVGSSVTRPGQMRIPFPDEGDVIGNDMQAGFLALCDVLAGLYSESNILGAPIATGVITPTVVTYGVDNNTIDESQPIVGYILNPFITSQVSRRKGHGS